MRYNDELKEKILLEYSKKDCSKKEFAKKNNISVSTLNRWLKSQKAEVLEKELIEEHKQPIEKNSEITQVAPAKPHYVCKKKKEKEAEVFEKAEKIYSQEEKANNFNNCLKNDNTNVVPAFDYRNKVKDDVKNIIKNYKFKIFTIALLIILCIIGVSVVSSWSFVNNYTYNQEQDAKTQDEQIKEKLNTYQSDFDKLKNSDDNLFESKTEPTVSLFSSNYSKLKEFENKILSDTSLLNTITGSKHNGYYDILNQLNEEKQKMQDKILELLENENTNISIPSEMFDGDNVKTDAEFEESTTYLNKYNSCFSAISIIEEIQSEGKFISSEKMEELTTSLQNKADKFKSLYLTALTKETYDAVNIKNKQEYENQFNSEKQTLEQQHQSKISEYETKVSALNKEIEQLKKENEEYKKKEENK